MEGAGKLPPEGVSCWTMQTIADELIRLELVDYITDTTVCEIKKQNQTKACKRMVHSASRRQIRSEDGEHAGGIPAPVWPLHPVGYIDETNK